MTHAEIYGVFVAGAIVVGLKLLLDLNHHLAEIAKELKHARENNAVWRERFKDADRH